MNEREDNGNKITDDLIRFCKKIPKLELHAHLNGSLSKETLNKLQRLIYPMKIEKHKAMEIEKCETMDEIFEIFSIAHSLTTTVEAIYIATYETIKEFHEDNVIYLELRSTPRTENGMSKEDYILAILRAIETCKSEGLNIIVKLLISVNRKQGFKAAKENIQLAIEMSKIHKNIVGIDLSGDPTKGDTFIQLLDQARKSGLKIAVHCAEVANEIETKDIIRFKPDRLGHCTCIHPNTNGTKELYQTLLNSKIPVELCLTSNIKVKAIPAYNAHHFKYLYESQHPICICTDDKGVFSTTLSTELMLIVENFHLNESDLISLMKSTVVYTFASDSEKENLIEIINQFENTICK